MENNLGEKNFEGLFNLLRLIYIKGKPQQDLLYEFENRIFKQAGLPSAGRAFLDSVAEYVKLYDALFVARDFLDSSDEEVKFKVMMWAMVNYFSASEWQACILSYAKKFGKSGAYEYLLALERVYVTHWVEAMRKDERYAVYTDLLKAIDSNKSYSDAIAAAKERSDDRKIREGCLVDNFYGVGYCRYMLLRAEISAGDNDDLREYTVRSVEHILPQNPKIGSQWLTWFSEQEISQVVNKAGNLVLLSKGKNSSASNKELAEKKTTYLKPRVSDFPRSVQVLGYDTWSRAIIDERTAQFADLILQEP